MRAIVGEARKSKSLFLPLFNFGTSVLPHFCSSVLLFFCFAALLLFFILQPLALGAEKWSGVDESVVEKYAGEHGREAREPLINTDQGDLLLFVFLLAGAIGGFFAGYYWKELTTKKETGYSTEITVKNNISGEKQKF